jgi:hypothetical protein
MSRIDVKCWHVHCNCTVQRALLRSEFVLMVACCSFGVRNICVAPLRVTAHRVMSSIRILQVDWAVDARRQIKQAHILWCKWHREMFDKHSLTLLPSYRVPKIKAVLQYSTTNVMHFLFNLLRIKGLYMFRAILAHPQDAIHTNGTWYIACVLSVGCYQDWSRTAIYLPQVKKPLSQ